MAVRRDQNEASSVLGMTTATLGVGPSFKLDHFLHHASLPEHPSAVSLDVQNSSGGGRVRGAAAPL